MRRRQRQTGSPTPLHSSHSGEAWNLAAHSVLRHSGAGNACQAGRTLQSGVHRSVVLLGKLLARSRLLMQPLCGTSSSASALHHSASLVMPPLLLLLNMFNPSLVPPCIAMVWTLQDTHCSRNCCWHAPRCRISCMAGAGCTSTRQLAVDTAGAEDVASGCKACCSQSWCVLFPGQWGSTSPV